MAKAKTSTSRGKPSRDSATTDIRPDAGSRMQPDRDVSSSAAPRQGKEEEGARAAQPVRSPSRRDEDDDDLGLDIDIDEDDDGDMSSPR